MSRPHEDWSRLASYVVSARVRAGFRDRREFARATGITDRTIGKLELGQPVGPETLAVVAATVGWKPDSPRRILAGGEPEPIQPPPAAGGYPRDPADPLTYLADQPRAYQEFAAEFIRNMRRFNERHSGAGTPDREPGHRSGNGA
jgi:hypothetical protein